MKRVRPLLRKLVGLAVIAGTAFMLAADAPDPTFQLLSEVEGNLKSWDRAKAGPGVDNKWFSQDLSNNYATGPDMQKNIGKLQKARKIILQTSRDLSNLSDLNDINRKDPRRVQLVANAIEYLTVLRLFHNVYVRSAHSYGHPSAYSFDYVKSLDLYMDKDMALTVVAQLSMYQEPPFNVWHSDSKTLGFGVSASARQVAEQSLYEKPKTKEEYVEAVAFSTLSQEFINRWSLRRLQPIYVGSKKARYSNTGIQTNSGAQLNGTSCGPGFLTFNHVDGRYTFDADFIAEREQHDDYNYRWLAILPDLYEASKKTYMQSNPMTIVGDAPTYVMQQNVDALSYIFDQAIGTTSKFLAFQMKYGKAAAARKKSDILDVLRTAEQVEWLKSAMFVLQNLVMMNDFYLEGKEHEALDDRMRDEIFAFHSRTARKVLWKLSSDNFGYTEDDHADYNTRVQAALKKIEWNYGSIVHQNLYEPIVDKISWSQTSESIASARMSERIDQVLKDANHLIPASAVRNYYKKTADTWDNLTLFEQTAPTMKPLDIPNLRLKSPSELKLFFTSIISKNPDIAQGFKAYPNVEDRLNQLFTDLEAANDKFTDDQLKTPAAFEAKIVELIAPFYKDYPEDKPNLLAPNNFVTSPKVDHTYVSTKQMPLSMTYYDMPKDSAVANGAGALSKLASQPKTQAPQPTKTQDPSMIFKPTTMVQDRTAPNPLPQQKAQYIDAKMKADAKKKEMDKHKKTIYFSPYSEAELVHMILSKLGLDQWEVSQIPAKGLIRNLYAQELYAEGIVSQNLVTAPVLNSQISVNMNSLDSRKVMWSSMSDLKNATALEALGPLYVFKTQTWENSYARDIVKKAYDAAYAADKGLLEDFCETDWGNYKNDDGYRSLFRAAGGIRNMYIQNNADKNAPIAKWDDEIMKETRTRLEWFNDEVMGPLMSVIMVVMLGLMVCSFFGITAVMGILAMTFNFIGIEMGVVMGFVNLTFGISALVRMPIIYGVKPTILEYQKRVNAAYSGEGDPIAKSRDDLNKEADDLASEQKWEVLWISMDLYFGAGGMKEILRDTGRTIFNSTYKLGMEKAMRSIYFRSGDFATSHMGTYVKYEKVLTKIRKQAGLVTDDLSHLDESGHTQSPWKSTDAAPKSIDPNLKYDPHGGGTDPHGSTKPGDFEPGDKGSSGGKSTMSKLKDSMEKMRTSLKKALFKNYMTPEQLKALSKEEIMEHLRPSLAKSLPENRALWKPELDKFSSKLMKRLKAAAEQLSKSKNSTMKFDALVKKGAEIPDELAGMSADALKQVAENPKMTLLGMWPKGFINAVLKDAKAFLKDAFPAAKLDTAKDVAEEFEKAAQDAEQLKKIKKFMPNTRDFFGRWKDVVQHVREVQVKYLRDKINKLEFLKNELSVADADGWSNEELFGLFSDEEVGLLEEAGRANVPIKLNPIVSGFYPFIQDTIDMVGSGPLKDIGLEYFDAANTLKEVVRPLYKNIFMMTPEMLKAYAPDEYFYHKDTDSYQPFPPKDEADDMKQWSQETYNGDGTMDDTISKQMEALMKYVEHVEQSGVTPTKEDMIAWCEKNGYTDLAAALKKNPK